MKRETSGKKFRQKVKKMKQWIRTNRHLRQEEFLKAIRSKLLGHYRYYGITDNYDRMKAYQTETTKLMEKWLNRRSQRKSFTRERFSEVIKKWQLPKPRIYVDIYK
nr:group II intron maturase-specific domain-containing protein [Cohnella fermenti]